MRGKRWREIERGEEDGERERSGVGSGRKTIGERESTQVLVLLCPDIKAPRAQNSKLLTHSIHLKMDQFI